MNRVILVLAQIIPFDLTIIHIIIFAFFYSNFINLYLCFIETAGRSNDQTYVGCNPSFFI